MKKIITISREYGSGGRDIAKMTAEKLGYTFYDQAIINTVSEATGLNPDYIKKFGENTRRSHIFNYGYNGYMGIGFTGFSLPDYLWQKQRELILYIAGIGNCVIVGRCADYILRERDDCLNVFIHADMESRKKRAIEVYGDPNKNIEKVLKDKDKTRKTNYRYYTDQIWGDASNYHLTLDSSEFGIEKCADFITYLAKQ
ncbi:MAG: cytidylate kinase-like family protein [Lachnospiraceae bacterium]|nr:cytidylate kinase-like family protein [Lachnospiraceae bacterium]